MNTETLKKMNDEFDVIFTSYLDVKCTSMNLLIRLLDKNGGSMDFGDEYNSENLKRVYLEYTPDIPTVYYELNTGEINLCYKADEVITLLILLFHKTNK